MRPTATVGKRVLRENEFDLYGPRPFPEQISDMVYDMVAQILRDDSEITSAFQLAENL